MIKVYGTDICIDCRNFKAILKSRNIENQFEYIDITQNTVNMREFFKIRDHADELEATRTSEDGAIGIPLFISEEGAITLDVNEAFEWIGQNKVEDSEIVEWR